MRVLLFSNDLMPFEGLPTSGGGLRAFQILRGLEAHGVEVLASMPGFTYLAEKYRNVIKPEQRELFWRWETQAELITRHKPDAVIFTSNWDHYALPKKPEVPLILDLHGSRLIENALWNSYVDRDKKARVLGMADCIICAGQLQRNYFNGWLVQAGRVPVDEQFIRYIPISLSPDQPERNDDEGEFPVIVSGGGWFPWQNQSKAIFAVSNSIERHQRGSFNIFGTPHETNNLSPAEQKIRDVYAQVRQMAERSDRVRVNGYIARDELVKIYSQAHVALELMEYNLERELAFTTRTIEYLWSGLPVLYNNYSEISRHISDYDAGWTISPDDDVAMALALDEMFNDRKLLKQKSENAKRLVADRFSWDKTIQPLIDFLNHPTRSSTVYPAGHSSFLLPSFLSPRGAVSGELLIAGETKTQKFIVPAVNIAALSIPVQISSFSDPFSVEVSVTDERGKIVIFRRLNSAEIVSESALILRFNPIKRPVGGAGLSLSLTLVEEGAAAPEIRLLAIRSAKYPLIVSGGTDAICINFVPGGGSVRRYKDYLRKAYHLVRAGEWGRLCAAVSSRL